jgi:chorismate dehydratase
MQIDRPRVGAVNYLNSKPLIEGLDQRASEVELVLDYPSRLADQLAGGQLAVALVPSIACLMDRAYEVVTDACVAARGAVLSVKLYSRVPCRAIRRLALDEGSRTSAALARILLAERHGVFPEVEPLPLTATLSDSRADAVLLIGDRAIHEPAETFAETWDLGEAWHAHTGLPFVFAMWAARRGAALGAVEQALIGARDLGVSRLVEIARRESQMLGLREAVCIDYLTRNLYYRLGSSERQGLARFHELTVKYGLAPKGVELVFKNCAAA